MRKVELLPIRDGEAGYGPGYSIFDVCYSTASHSFLVPGQLGAHSDRLSTKIWLKPLMYILVDFQNEIDGWLHEEMILTVAKQDVCWRQILQV